MPRKEGGHLVFDTPAIKIAVHPDQRRFIFFRGDKPGGSGAISAVMQVTDCDYRTAIRWLAADFGIEEIQSSMRSLYEDRIRQNAKEAVAHPFTIDEKLAKYAPIVQATWPSVREYLVSTRCLPRSWIDSLHHLGHVWSNDHGSACFAHRNMSGQIVGASIRGTSKISKFHQTIGNKADGFFRFAVSNSSPSQIAVVESPIEAISLACLNRNARTLYASTAGAGGLVPILDLARESAWKVLAAQNDDAAGEIQALYTAELCGARNLPYVRLRPPFKDWNDTLTYLRLEMSCDLRRDDQVTRRLQAAWSHGAHAHLIALQAAEPASLLPETVTIFTETTTNDTTLSL